MKGGALRYMEMNLMPLGYKSYIRTIKKVGIYAVMGALLLLLILNIFGYLHDGMTAAVVLAVLLLITVPLLIPGLAFDKVSQSTVQLTDGQLRVLDKRGRCWRTIDYSVIKAIQVQEIRGFFYGQNKGKWRHQFVCVFLNESFQIPDTSFAKLFTHQDFFMFDYQLEALRYLQEKHRAH